MMTEAEMEYLTSMEEVKTISKKLVSAEQAFTLVRDRIEKLVSKYEHLLSKIDAESCAASSVMTYESSYYSEHDSQFWEARDREIWARRAKRAEVKAELAARETLLAKQEVRMIQEEKQRELDELRQKLLELQSESSYAAMEREHSMTLAKSMTMRRHDSPTPAAEQPNRIDKDKLDGVKKRFRDRMAARKQSPPPPPSASPLMMRGGRRSPPSVTPSPQQSKELRDLFRSAGEEMCQQLDFYERSLRAVESTRND